MEFEEFVDWTSGEVERGHFTSGQRDRVLVSRRLFDRDDDKEPGTVVGYLGEVRLVDESVTGILSQAREQRGAAGSDDLLYFEPIAHNPLGV